MASEQLFEAIGDANAATGGLQYQVGLVEGLRIAGAWPPGPESVEMLAAACAKAVGAARRLESAVAVEYNIEVSE